MSDALGIDLGTYNSSAAVALNRDDILIVKSSSPAGTQGKNFPSFVQFDPTGSIVSVGELAKNAAADPALVVWGVKRLVGLSYDAALAQEDTRRFRYKIERGPGNTILIRVGSERFTPSHILEAILRQIKADAEDSKVNPALSGPFHRVTISIPAYFQSIRVDPIIEAARQAGFSDVETIAEPTAAAIRYGLRIDRDAIVLAVDLGAGTLDVTVLQIVRENDALALGEICTAGHESLGGIDMDDILWNHLIEKHRLQHSSLLRDEVERAKIALSKVRQTTVLCPDSQDIALTRDELADILSPFLLKCRRPIGVALREAGLQAADVDHVMLVGGPTHMPCVRTAIYEELRSLGARPDVLAELKDIDVNGFPVSPMECVSQGAALKASRVVMPACTSLPEGLGIAYGNIYAPLIQPNSMYPIDGRQGMRFPDPNSKHLSVQLIAKRVDNEKSTDTTVYHYEQLGTFSLSITPTGELPQIEILLKVSKDKELTATLTDQHTGECVVYRRPDLFTSEALSVTEGEPPPWDSKKMDGFRANYRAEKASWTNHDLEQVVALAMKLLERVKGFDHQLLHRGSTALQSALNQSAAMGAQGAPVLANALREFLDLLRQPEIGLLRQEEFRAHLTELEKIGT